MNILFVSAETAPFAKTGGLGDVSAALPRALARDGHDVRVVLPYYRRVYDNGHQVTDCIGPIEVELGGRRFRFETKEARLPGSDVPVYFVHCPALYDRPNIYTNDPDEHIRFALLNWAALHIAQRLGFSPDVAHVNDWQTCLIPLLLRRNFGWDQLFERTRTVLTIHNIGHQGTFGSDAIGDVGMWREADAFHQEQLAEGRMSFLLTGILYANAITTVSPTYAHEIQTPEHGVGLDGFLRGRADVLRGILNGIDEDVWNPATDKLIPANFSADDKAGKEDNKRALLEACRLPYRAGAPLFGIVSRLTWQKGFDLCFEALPALLGQSDAQLVVLGSGEPRYERFFTELARRAPDRVAFKNGFSEPFAHAIEAGSDLFLMPSRYEPCGLNQMYSFRYGTPPVVHHTGGLADTVRHWNPYTGEGNGFVFDFFDVRGLKWAIGEGLRAFADRDAWLRLVDNCMREELGWTQRVREYEQLYRALAA